MHIWLIRVSSSNPDTVVASCSLSRRIHRTPAAGARCRLSIWTQFDGAEAWLLKTAAITVELVDAVSKVDFDVGRLRSSAGSSLHGSPRCRGSSRQFVGADRQCGIENFSAPIYASLRAIPARSAAICHRFPRQPAAAAATPYSEHLHPHGRCTSAKGLPRPLRCQTSLCRRSSADYWFQKSRAYLSYSPDCVCFLSRPYTDIPLRIPGY